jgi:ABC-type phosphate/phosphonate transport system substrate-binding protein
MKKFMMGLVLTALSTAQLASADTFTDRRALLDKAKATGQKPIEVGFNPGNNGKKEELFFWTNKYWPLANNLTTQTGDNISFIPENDAPVLLNLVRSQKYKWLYVQPNIAVIAQEHGYTPLGYLNKEIESVFVVPAEGGISKTADLKGKNIATLVNSNDLRLAKYYLHTENWNA